PPPREPREPGTHVAAGLGAPDVIVVPPLDADEIAELLVRHGLPYRLAGRIHQASGGNPRLALTVGRSLKITRRSVHYADGLPLTGQSRLAARRMLDRVAAPVREALLLAALAHQPTAALLRRAGRPAADAELADAEQAGLISLGEDGAVAFTAGVLRSTLVAEADQATRAAGHAALAEAVYDPVHAVRHRALAGDAVDEALATALTEAAATARSRGNRALAAELGLLAADRTPADRPGPQLARLVTAAQDAGRACRADLARRAANAIMTRDAAPADRVRARLAVFDTAGQDLADLDEDYAHALQDAEGDIRLQAAVQLRLTWKYLLSEGNPGRSREAAIAAAALARRAGDASTEAEALAVRARVERSLGIEEAERRLAEARALEVAQGPAGALNPAQILTIRHALFDDRLAEAQAQLIALLPVVERRGTAEDVIEVCATLAEVQARLGQCTSALGHARRSLELTLEAGLSPGPAWYASAVAEAVGGSFARAESYARRGVQASEEEHDQIFLARNRYVLGRVQLITGNVAAAVRTLRSVQDLETAQQVVDPSIVRWHEELALALVATDEPARAAELIAATRPTAERLGRDTVLLGLDRAHAMCLAAQGEPETAVGLLRDLARRYAERDLLPEQGRTLVDVARLERRRRRRAPAQAALQAAAEVFTRLGAKPWLALTAEPVAAPRPDRTTASRGTATPLTEAELRLAHLVCQGASNQEAAAKMFLSVKTVEARLTRIYQKLDVRSRAQLAAALRHS
ncbi:LuxR family transcriptional regulator, partial [Streptomyces palmae]